MRVNRPPLQPTVSKIGFCRGFMAEILGCNGKHTLGWSFLIASYILVSCLVLFVLDDQHIIFHPMEKVKSVTSKQVTRIKFWYWLDKEETHKSCPVLVLKSRFRNYSGM